ncbi:hypothetical protein PF002_g3461 [Phytophthora fragariae]|uniref:Uncharacterized protein n=1 Tax=Phytophthora fragariae TaxID=53985 RepID=A0A6A4AA58_9STRA|nr:hypothetical protein PF003_g21819 [Phytophthora fragariae]KAE9253169.1 hypothetical protein PF002_g3461 [Phytophthora fragariae]
MSGTQLRKVCLVALSTLSRACQHSSTRSPIDSLSVRFVLLGLPCLTAATLSVS